MTWNLSYILLLVVAEVYLTIIEPNMCPVSLMMMAGVPNRIFNLGARGRQAVTGVREESSSIPERPSVWVSPGRTCESTTNCRQQETSQAFVWATLHHRCSFGLQMGMSKTKPNKKQAFVWATRDYRFVFWFGEVNF